MTTNKILRTVIDLKGTPFVAQGRSRRGLDCVGLLVVAIREAAGVKVKSREDYSLAGEDYSESLCTLLSLIANKLPKHTACQPADVFLFASNAGGQAKHLGVLTSVGEKLEDYMFAHTTSKTGKVVEHQLDGRWMTLIHSRWRLKEEIRGDK